MFSWIKRKKSANREEEVARSIAIAVELLRLPIGASSNTPEGLLEKEPEFFSGYLAGFADVFAQSSGGSPGGSLSQEVTYQMLLKLFPENLVEELMSQLVELMQSASSDFDNGMQAGGEDANSVLSKRLPIKLAQHLGLSV